ncbi:prepilin peptidase [Clostridium oceanicum]|uniref:Prepilin type IV endopeptidase peptidase domain-containing protein n=1 Tax=Clostridium oceanicum TaxID=1543 RepID=A0ABN1JR42_9CLOT
MIKEFMIISFIGFFIGFLLYRYICRIDENNKKKYPKKFIEIITMVLFVILYLRYGICLKYVKYITYICYLITAGIIDFYTKKVYIKPFLIIFMIQVSYIIIDAISGKQILEYVLGGLVVGGLIYLIAYFTKAMGAGDGDIFLITGLLFGFEKAFLILTLSCILGSIIGLIIVMVRKKQLQDSIPFIPIVSLTSLIVIILNVNFMNILQ